jgi:MerR family copper efflux transcriptional regulator
MNKSVYIGELSKKAGVPVKTIRYYEDLGLLENPKRSFSQYRIYSQKDIDKLLFIKKSKELGLTLSEIKRILGRSRKGLEPTCCAVHEVFNQKIIEYEGKIKELTVIKKKLEQKLQSWITPREAKKMNFTICPQIEVNQPSKKRR